MSIEATTWARWRRRWGPGRRGTGCRLRRNRSLARYIACGVGAAALVACAPTPVGKGAADRAASSAPGAAVQGPAGRSDGAAAPAQGGAPVPGGHAAQSATWARDGSYLLADICPRRTSPSDNCTLYRYRLATARWEPLPQLAGNHTTGYLYPAFSPDGKSIAATEVGFNCDEAGCPPSKVGSRLVLLDAEGGRIRYLSGHGLRLRPSFSNDGKRLLYWRGDVLRGGRGIYGFWDVYELDLATGRERQMSNFAAEGIAAPPRYWPDGKRILLVARNYRIKPNATDYRHPGDPNYQAPYDGIHGRNGSVVIEPGERRVWPYFRLDPPHRWLLVRDISPDGKWVVFDRHGGLVERPVDDPLDQGRVLLPLGPLLLAAAYSPDGRQLALVPEIGTGVLLLDLGTLVMSAIAIDW